MFLRNLRAQWAYKFVGVTAFLGIFFVAYFWLIRTPRFPVRVMRRGWVDDWVGIHGAALPLYLSLWIYVVLAVGLIVSKRGLARFLVGATGISLSGFVFFYFRPTAVLPPTQALADDSWLRWLAHVDATGNACPSLHVAFVVFSAGWILLKLRRARQERWARWGVLAWGAGIIYSTMATGQHVAFDVVAGAVLGAVALAIVRPRDGEAGKSGRY